MKRQLIGLLAGGLLLVAAAPAVAATVTVRVEGSAATLVPATRVALPDAPFKPDGTNDCAAASAGGALWAATGGRWSGTYYPSFSSYLVTSVMDEAPAYPDSWGFYVNGRKADQGVCQTSAQEGDAFLFYVDRCESGPPTYDCTNPPVMPLALTAPARPRPGEPFTVTVEQLAADGTRSAAAGVTVSGGAASATTDAQGHATLSLPGGAATLVAAKPGLVRDSADVCATTGADGLCGTTVPAASAAPTASPAPTTAAAIDNHASFGRITTVRNGKHYKKRHGPRQLAGLIDPDPSGLKNVELRLTRRVGKRCTTYNAKTERLVKMKRCGATRGRWFSVGDRNAWTYLLPTRLPRGRYVLDLRVTDNAGNVNDHLIRGRSRMVFFVA